ncbi:ATP-binding cassette domain-containing protein [Thorsellia anophelis]|uniref:Putative thiamine transport system ATP-binding protein n=1 Tax=Thorsellia anophelis DSM 18579 TaxID=1123402 RepID=A0A1I0C910_9GAMM|nr:ATP-binding cassette domain-containing protein [Thorsellia anophelis]SET15614.1 putative thiamine transport system ATP-binding protein [Thorsellia anophelis DSM 18579]
MLKINQVNIVKRTSPDTAFLTLDVTINPGEIVTLMGPSGSGKSTLLNYILGHLPPAFIASGAIELNGLDITDKSPYLRKIGILYQTGLLFPHLTVFENVALGLSETVSKSERIARISELLDKVGLLHCMNRMPETLSGGEYIRVALVRTLASNPKALLLDEPFSKLDEQRREEVRAWVFDYALIHQIPVLLVTHDKQDAIAAASRIIEINATNTP